MDVDDPSDLGIDDIVDFQDLCHHPDHFIEVSVIEVEDHTRSPRSFWRFHRSGKGRRGR
jgi:hypothetical protein